MFASLKIWWNGHAPGERILLGTLGAVILVVVLWLGVWRPVTDGLASGWDRQGAALDRYGAVRAKVDALRALPAANASADARLSIDQLVGQSAAEAGFALDRSGAQGAGRVSIAIASARMGPLLAWLARLEAAGVQVQTVGIAPGATEGTVAFQAVLAESGR